MGTRSSAASAPSRSPRCGADPGQAERGGGGVVGVAAGADHVERLGHVGLAARLAGRGERQLGRQLAGHLAVDGVERGLRPPRPSPRCERGQARQPDRPPLPRVVGEDLLGARRRRRPGAGLDRRPARGRAAPRRSRSGAARAARSRSAGSSTLTRGQPAAPRVGRVDLERRAASSQAQRVDRVGRAPRTAPTAAECSAGCPGPRSVATTSRSTPSSCPRISSTAGEPVGRVGRAGLGDQPVERVVLLEQRGRRRPAAATRRRSSGSRGSRGTSTSERAPDRVDVGGDRRADAAAPRAPGSRRCRRSRESSSSTRRTPPRSISLTPSPTWIMLSGLKSQ